MSDKTSSTGGKLPAISGLSWVTGTLELFKRQPLRLLLIGLFFQLLLGFSQAGVLGFLVILCLPAFSAGMLHAFFTVDQGQKPALGVLFLPFSGGANLGRLILLGGMLMFLGMVVISMLLAGQVSEIDAEIIRRIEGGDLEALQAIDPAVVEQAVLAMALGATLGAALSYFSVPLIWFRKRGVGNAVTSGLIAMARNWRPLLVLGLIVGLLAIPVGLLFSFFYLSVLAGSAPSTWLAILMLVAGPVFQLLLFGTQYLAFRDIFDLQIQTRPQDPVRDSQLVA